MATGAIAILLLVILTLIAVVMRYFFNNPISGTEDLSAILLTVFAGASVAYGARHKSHVSVDIISRIFGPNLTRFTDQLMRAIVVFTGVLATYALFAKACGPEKACITGNFNISYRPFYYALAAAIGYLTLVAIYQFWINLVKAPEPHDEEAAE